MSLAGVSAQPVFVVVSLGISCIARLSILVHSAFRATKGEGCFALWAVDSWRRMRLSGTGLLGGIFGVLLFRWFAAVLVIAAPLSCVEWLLGGLATSAYVRVG